MKSTAALVALLPLLATLSPVVARPHNHRGDKHPKDVSHRSRKTLGFGPTLSHAAFEAIPLPDVAITAQALVHEDPRDVARKFIEEKVGMLEGEGFYIREDSYTDKHTGMTHIYARQLYNGHEVSDGDMNVNIDRYGRIVSFGNSFYSGIASSVLGDESTEPKRICDTLKSTLKVHKSELKTAKGDGTGPWGLVKAAGQMVLGDNIVHYNPPKSDREIKVIKKNIRHIKDHIKAVCDDDDDDDFVVAAEGHLLEPAQALRALLPKISTVHDLDDDLELDDFVVTEEHSFVPNPAPAETSTITISGPGLAKAGVVGENVPVRRMYTQVSDGGPPRMVYKMEVQLKDNWYEAYVDASKGKLLRIIDWASDIEWDSPVEAKKGGKQKPLPGPPKKGEEAYTYQVFPWGINDPSVGNISIETKPWDQVASPLGWHVIPTKSNPWGSKLPGMNITGNITTFHTTAGNNIIAHEDWEGQNNFLNNYRPINDSMSFIYDYGEYDGLAPKEYADMVITQLFYTSNMYHDLLYRMGFDEISGNFQAHNFGLGGKEGDYVICNAQDGSGYNNANFMTPPDGQPGRMRMYVWDTTTPYRDGDVEAGIVIHEYSHGLSTRLTGGPANSGCLAWGEAGGYGEGAGDFLATLIRQIEEHKNFANGTDIFSMGAFAANRDAGIRNFKYSTNSTVNPSTYKTLDKPGYFGVHAIGEVIAEMFFVMSQRLVEKHGFSKTLFPPTNTSEPNDYYTTTLEESVDHLGKPKPLIPKHGNTLAFQLVVNGMKLQPCRPSFFNIRDAIIQADQMLTGGDNACLLWKAFAERGLGADATVIGQTPWGGGIREAGFKVPAKVCKEEKE